MTLFFNASGQDGHAGTPGVPGKHGDVRSTRENKRKGKHGTDAGPAESGTAAGHLKLLLRLDDGDRVVAERLDVTAPANDDETRQMEPLADFSCLDWKAQGGHGGQGGKGGDGGHGAPGSNGKDATKFERGTDGTHGVAGGNGGKGTSGANAGHGGNVEIVVPDQDTFLLMNVEGCDPVHGIGNRVRGGKGGKPGVHGAAGKGGAAGIGGKPFSYMVEKEKSEYDFNKHKAGKPGIQIRHRDKEQNMVYYLEQKTQEGGIDGLAGDDGTAHTSPLKAGKDGKTGSFQIAVHHGQGDKEEEEEEENVEYYTSRYDLELVDTDGENVSKIPSKNGAVPTYEFGETVVISSARIKNTGGMMTPSQRIAIQIDPEACHNLTPATFGQGTEPSALFVPDRLEPGESGRARQGAIGFTVDKPDFTALGPDFEPIRQEGHLFLRAFQLGPQRSGVDTNAQMASAFCAPYKRFDEHGKKFELAFPVENRTGVIGLGAVSMGESTSVKFTLFNNSNSGLGIDSTSKRRLVIQYTLRQDIRNQLGLDEISFYKPNTKTRLSLDPAKTNSDGFIGTTVQVKDLSAKKGKTFEHKLRLSEDARPFTRAALQADVFLQDIPTLLPNGTTIAAKSYSLVQRRLLVVSCQPSFQPKPNSDVVLVSTADTTRDQNQAWMKLLTKQLGLEVELYSLALYGHLDPTKEIEYKTESGLVSQKLGDLFSGKLIVLLNDVFSPLPNERRKFRCRPASLLTKFPEFDPTTRWLIVGGPADGLKHLSSSAVNLLPYLQYDEHAQNEEEIEDPTITSTGHMDYSQSTPAEEPIDIVTESTPQSGYKVPTPSKQPFGSAKKASSSSVYLTRHEDTKSFKEWMKEALALERTNTESSFSNGLQPGCNIITITKNLGKDEPDAKKVAEILRKERHAIEQWLKKEDPIRNYAIEFQSGEQLASFEDGRKVFWELGDLRVYRGEARNKNSLVVVSSDSPAIDMLLKQKEAIESAAFLYSVMSGLPLNVKIHCYCEALKENNETVVQVIHDSLVSDFLWDVSHFYDSKMDRKSSNPEERSTTIQGMADNGELKSLLDTKDDVDLIERIKSELSMLVAHLQGCADSKDLAPWWSPFSRKHGVRRSLNESVTALEASFGDFVDRDTVRNSRKELDEEVKQYLKNDRKKMLLRRKQRWRAGLAHVHSTQNSSRYSLSSTSSGEKSLTLLVSRQASVSSESTASPRRASFNKSSPAKSTSTEPTKIRKCVPVAMDPEETELARVAFDERLSFAQKVEESVTKERSAFLGN